MNVKKAAFLLPCALLAGCFTLKQTPMPQVEMSRAPQGADVKVAVSGFAATITDYIPVYGHQTVYVDHGPYYGRHGFRYWGGGHYETVTSSTMVPQVRASDAFVTRAQNLLEDAGFLVRAPQPDYTLDVTFEGPFVRDDERAVEFAWLLC